MLIPQFIRKLFDTHGEDQAVLYGYDPGSSRGDMLIIEEGKAPPPPRPPKPRVRILPGGWIRHDGAVFPFPSDIFVEVVFEGGAPSGNPVQRAKEWPDAWWRMRAGDPRYNIRFYRLAVYSPTAIDPRELPL